MSGKGAACLTGLAVVLSAAGSMAGQDPPCNFHPTRDFGTTCNIVLNPTDPSRYNFVSTGTNYRVLTNAFCGMVYMDFDRNALRSYVGVGQATRFRTRFCFVPREAGNVLAGSRWSLASWYAGCDWVEGDGQAAMEPWTMSGDWWNWYDDMYNWSEGTTAAGKWSPAMRWKWEGMVQAPDLDNMSGWKYPDGTELYYRPEDWSFEEHHKGLEELYFHAHDRFNSTDIFPMDPPDGSPWPHYEMLVDPAVMEDLLGDVAITKCRGLRMWAGADTADPRSHDTAGMSTRWMYTREAGAVTEVARGTTTVAYDYRPYLEILRLGDVNKDTCVNILDLGVLAANYRGTGKVWEQGDFNGDGTVNILDLGVLAASYRWCAAAPAGGEQVPEPALAAMLAAGAGVLAARRRRRERGR